MVIACGKTNLSTESLTTTPTNQPFTVTFSSEFNSIGSNTVMPNPSSITITPPATSIDALPTPPTMSGYIFGGWWSAAGCNDFQYTDANIASTTFTTNSTIYGCWYEYQVTFESDSSTVSISGTVPPATTVNALATPPTKTGYTFGGWWTATGGGGTQFFADTPVTADITVYAQWLTNTNPVYVVTYVNPGLLVATLVATQYVTSPATTVGTLPTPPTQLFYTFANWYTLSDNGSIKTVFDENTPVTADITVYAQWSPTPGYTVTFNSGWGTSVNAQYVIPKGATVSTSTWPTSAWPTDPTKPCYTFGGWWTAENGGGSPFTASTPVTADITVYAQWIWYPQWTVAGSTTTTPPSTYAIGDPGPSCVGKVFYITDGGLHGLEAAPPSWYDPYADSPDPELVWISGDPIDRIQQTQSTLNGNTSTAIGTGLANSNAIITQSGTTASSYSAAGLCEAYAGGGYSDWFLPSKDELAQLYAQRDAGQWGGFSEEDGYWSSSEYNAFYAWSQYFIDPNINTSIAPSSGTLSGIQIETLKSEVRYIRPVRAF